MVRSHAFGRRTACCFIVIALAATAGCTSEQSVHPDEESNVEIAELGIGPETVRQVVTALTATPSGVWGNGRALRATPLVDGRTAVVTTIGIDIIDGSNVMPLDRFATTTLISAVAASTDSSTLAVATTAPSQITWYDLEDGVIAGRQELAPNFLVRDIAFGADAATLWVQTDNLLTTLRVDDTAPDLVDSVETRVGAPAVSAADASGRSALLGTNQIVTVAADGATHIDTIRGLADEVVGGTRMSPSGALLAVMVEAESGSEENPKRVVVLDASSLVPQAAIVLAPTANSLVWTLSDTHLAIATGADVELHSLDSSEMTFLEGAGASTAHSLFIVDDAVVAVLSDGTIVRWTSNNSTSETLAGPTESALESASLATDGSSVVAVDRSGVITTVRLAPTGTGGATADPIRLDEFAVGEVTNVDIDEASARIAGSTTTGDVVVLDPMLSVQSRFPVATGPVGFVAFVPGSTDIITGLSQRTGSISFDDTVAAWDPVTGQARFRIGGESEDVLGCSSFYNRIEFLNGGAVMATTSHDFTVGLADTNTGEELFRFEPEISTLLDIAVTPDGSKLIVSSDLGTYTVWNVADRAKVATREASMGGYRVLATLPDNRTMATTSIAGVLGLVDIETGERLVEFGAIDRGASPPEAIALSPDGSLLATPTGDDAVGIWSTVTGQRLATLLGHTSAVTDVEFGPDMTFLVTSSSDGTIRTWTLDISTG